MSFAKQRIEELTRELAQAEEELTLHTVEVLTDDKEQRVTKLYPSGTIRTDARAGDPAANQHIPRFRKPGEEVGGAV